MTDNPQASEAINDSAANIDTSAIPATPPDERDTPANAIIAAGVAATAGMGWVPAFVDIGWLVIANSAMIGSLALLYQYKWTADNTKNFVGRLIGDSGVAIIPIKALAALLDLTGIGLPLGIALNGTLNAAITLALGKSAQHYFKNQGQIPDDELIKFFKETLNLKQFLGKD